MTQTVESPSQDSFWESDELPPPEVAEQTSDDTHLINPPENTCAGCGEEVVRQPGQRGKLAKYHPECKPVRGKGSGTAGPRPVRVTAKDRQAAEEIELALDNLRRGLAKAVMMLALADPYDALVLHVNTPDLLNNLRPILMRFPGLRKGASEASTIGSIIGLVATVLTVALPILTHHGLLPKSKLSKLFLNIPMFMMRMQERLSRVDTDEEVAEELLVRVTEERRAKAEAMMRARTAAETVDASPTR